MMAESLPFCGTAGPLSGLELEAWYEDLQDILSSETKNTAAVQLVSDEQVETLDGSPYLWTLESIDSTLSVNFTDEEVVALETVVNELPSEVLEFLAQESHNDFENPSTSESLNDQQDRAFDVDSSCSSCPSQTHTEDEDSSGSQCGTKRKRDTQPRGGKIRKEKEQENDKKVAHLASENERLKSEIERLTLEVEKTRKSLIERMVNLKK
ncbi:DNA damage-inducible transcript 3 protein [Bufo gargarizans]|uniref:DNA damage-inducible transcript 3 protein n=1 Tax=Bufo gargarizans TaxID=30331 RepID=UPI001CF17336|nr:DNA damage-inducible transcript 3 protein [Bufo gargarizans]